MTFGEMLQWTNRLKDILNGSENFKSKRLMNMLNDIVEVDRGKCLDPHLLQIYVAVSEELEVA